MPTLDELQQITAQQLRRQRDSVTLDELRAMTSAADMGQTWVREDISEGTADVSNYMQRASDRIQRYQQARSDAGKDRLTAIEQVAIVDAYRQMAGIQPEGYYLTKDGAAVPKDQFAELQRKKTEDSDWENFKSNTSGTVMQMLNGIRANQAKITDALGITDNALTAAMRDEEEINRILQPRGGKSGFAGQLVGNVMNLYLGGFTSAPGRFAVSTAGSTFIDVAHRRTEGQEISATAEWTAAISNAAIEYALEMFGQKIAMKAGARLSGSVGSMTKAISGQGIRGGIRAAAGVVTKFGIEQGGLAAQGFAEESITELLQNTVRRVAYAPEQAITEGIWQAGLQGAFMPIVASPGTAAMQRWGGSSTSLVPDSSSPAAGDQTLAGNLEQRTELKPEDYNEALDAENNLPDSLKSSLPAEADIPDARDHTGADPKDLMTKWHGDRAISNFKAKQNAANKQTQIKDSLQEGDTVTNINDAIAVYIDMKENSDAYAVENIRKLTKDQQSLVDRAMTLSQGQQMIADQIIAENKSLGIEALEAGIIQNFKENYLARIWKSTVPGSRRAKFTIATPRQRQRTLPSLIEGWANGLELEVPGAVEAQLIATQQISQVIHDRNLVNISLKSGVFSDHRTDEHTHEVKHPNFKKWVAGAKGPPGEVKSFRGDTFATPEGVVMHRATMWADKKTARHLNNALGSSELFNMPGVGEVLKYNQILKHAVLTISGFHYFAFLRSYMLMSRGLNPITGYRQGKDLVLGKNRGLEPLVRRGLTIGDQIGLDIAADHEATRIGKIISKVPAASQTRRALIALSRANSKFLFNKFGTYLKANAAYLDYQYRMKKNAQRLRDGKITEQEIATSVASAYNADFGGLNLEFEGRNPTMQAIHKALSLAPDWTESNIRTMVGAFKRGEAGRVYRGMWGRVLLKGVGATVIANLMTAAMDDEETFWSQYKKAWDAGNLKWTGVDITPIARMFGNKTPGRKYIHILGHLADPIKFMVDPVKSAKSKMSMMARMLWEAGSGEDWRGRRFTSFGELLSTGKLSDWEAFGSGPIGWETLPSFLAKQAEQSTPVAVQAAINRMRGEIDTFDMITRSLGNPTYTVKPRKQVKRKRVKKQQQRKKK